MARSAAGWRAWSTRSPTTGPSSPGSRTRRESCEPYSLQPGEVVDTRRFENPDGSGDLYFLGEGHDQWLPIGFLEVPQVGLVEALVRETLLDAEDQDWWKFGTAGAC